MSAAVSELSLGPNMRSCVTRCAGFRGITGSSSSRFLGFMLVSMLFALHRIH